MSNNELIAKIKAEIERRTKELDEQIVDIYDSKAVLRKDELQKLLSFLSTLEPGKPMVLGERIGSYNIVPYIDDKIAKLQDMWREEKVSFDWDDLKDTIEEIARHFAEWGYLRAAEKYDEIEYNRQRTEESVPKDLEEHASRAGFDYVDNIAQEHPGHRFNDHDVEYAYRDAFIAGAKWQEDHTPLPEDTVLFNKGVAEGKRLVMEDAVEGEFLYTPYPTIALDDCKDYNFKDNQKVRIIIVKEN